MGLFGYTSLKDFFDGGGPGASRDTSKDNKPSKSKTSKAVKSAAKKIVGGIGDFAGGIQNDVSMGFNPETRDQDYYRRTMDTINRTRGLEAAQDYYDRMGRSDDANVRGFFGGTSPDVNVNRFYGGSQGDSISGPTEQLAPRIGGHPGGSISGGGFVPPDAGDGTGPVDEDGNPIAPGEEEIEYTYMPPFFGGYQPATRADTLVPSQERGIGSFLPNPRLDPIFPQQPPPENGLYRDGMGMPMLPMPPGNGIANLFGNEQAPPYMYQGIMS